MLWKEQGFFTSAGQRVSNGEEIHNLLEAVQFPAEIAVVPCPACTRGITGLGRGNAPADTAVKAQPGSPWDYCATVTLSNGCPD